MMQGMIGKLLRVLLVFAGTLLLLAVLCAMTLDLWIYPQTAFDAAHAPTPPDYSRESSWAALPHTPDGADITPGDERALDAQLTARADVFFIHPTTYLVGGNWNAEADSWLASKILQMGVLPQQAAAFNGVARVYAPHYRQASQGGQVQDGHEEDKAKMLALAYSDVRRAFDHFLDHYNDERPFFIASHSQGTDHGLPLLNDLFQHRPEDARRLIAAYLIGNTVVETQLPAGLPVCESAGQTGCLVSWNTVLEGGDGSHWQGKVVGQGEPVCVNPLSWTREATQAAAQLNRGAIPITGPSDSQAPDAALVGARCENGILWITQPEAPGYSLALFPGGGYHAYDYNLFYMNLRENAAERAAAFRPRQRPPRLPKRKRGTEGLK